MAVSVWLGFGFFSVFIYLFFRLLTQRRCTRIEDGVTSGGTTSIEPRRGVGATTEEPRRRERP